MLVTLAYPYQGHQPDETVDLPPNEARRLLRDGYARPAGTGELQGRTVAELRSYAAEHGIDLAGTNRKADIVAAIDAAESSTSTRRPPGDNPEEDTDGR